jgi:hypothetical protein
MDKCGSCSLTIDGTASRTVWFEYLLWIYLRILKFFF